MTRMLALSGIFLLCVAIFFYGEKIWLPARRPLFGGEVASLAKERSGPSARHLYSLENVSDFVLVVEMIRVAFSQGASVPDCLIKVGQACPENRESSLMRVGSALKRGEEWESAWRPVIAGNENLRLLRSALEPAWHEGSTPEARLGNLCEMLLEAQETAIETSASRLSVRLLLPLGCCFLPAFVLIGVIPCVAAFAGVSL
ncbi:MAG: hypothetical protein LKJ44_08340 [Bifidobacteriaceae bacterium]|nr:hypothetical protein [Bifidobacteriaceae bacterium]MCI1979693.1 hypothetical protein [Bifidobacteriaceae bacterium]